MKQGDIVGGRYEVRSHIGSGGMQDVYLADDRLLQTQVALKTPQTGQGVRRFKQSAKISARINHHNVAKTLDYLEDQGTSFLLEEYVAGETLEAKLQRLPFFDPHLASQALHHLAKGLSASHHVGVVHRDLKPSNIMTSSGVNLTDLKITDFGIATLTEDILEDAAKDGELTRSTSGTIKGALPYMAPEMMFRQPGEHPGKPADVWSLGAMMFRLLTGEYPFGVFLTAAVNVKNKDRKPWPRFMTRNPQFEQLAKELQDIIDRCLSYEPSERPTADELVLLCQAICYSTAVRVEGTVTRLIQNNYSGIINSDHGKTYFFSMESVYGTVYPDIKDNARVCISSFPGNPHDRAHPILVMRSSSNNGV